MLSTYCTMYKLAAVTVITYSETVLVNITINVPVVFLARYIMVLFWAQMALTSLVPFQGPKKSRFSGPTPSNAPRNDVAALKTIKYKLHKNNRYIGSFMYPSAVVYCCCVLLCVRGVGMSPCSCVVCLVRRYWGGGGGGWQASPLPLPLYFRYPWTPPAPPTALLQNI